ncbi:hypothetical protein BRD56_08370 [Thermoplasmatales archaeon SW_10_69_26]|nr:MAG: hypothetical protein BRD56_08370 [Thermoplasmatales archaeon SW_10_69_26]
MPELARRTEPDREDPEHRIRVEVDEGTVVRRARVYEAERGGSLGEGPSRARRMTPRDGASGRVGFGTLFNGGGAPRRWMGCTSHVRFDTAAGFLTRRARLFEDGTLASESVTTTRLPG